MRVHELTSGSAHSQSAMTTMHTTRNEAGLTTTQVKLPPVRVDRAALDALCDAARTAIDSANSTQVTDRHGFDEPRVMFSATFKRRRRGNRETVRIDESDLALLGEPVRTSDWSISATRRLMTMDDDTIRIHAFNGRARLSVTSRDGAWRRATIASILDVVDAYPPRYRACHHWTARAAAGIVTAAATAAGSLLTPTGLQSAIDIGLAALCGTIYGGWAMWGHSMVSKRHSHVLVLAPVDRNEDDDA